MILLDPEKAAIDVRAAFCYKMVAALDRAFESYWLRAARASEHAPLAGDVAGFVRVMKAKLEKEAQLFLQRPLTYADQQLLVDWEEVRSAANSKNVEYFAILGNRLSRAARGDCLFDKIDIAILMLWRGLISGNGKRCGPISGMPDSAAATTVSELLARGSDDITPEMYKKRRQRLGLFARDTEKNSRPRQIASNCNTRERCADSRNGEGLTAQMKFRNSRLTRLCSLPAKRRKL